LIGEPFRFSRISYGDELTLHFGDLRPAQSAKLKAHPYGTYILGLRASPWLLKSGSESMAIITVGVNPDTALTGTPMTKEEIEADPIIRRDSHVVAVTPFLFKQSNAIGLRLATADGSTLFVLPNDTERDEVLDETTPQIADWELITPNGLINAGPGPRWSFGQRSDFIAQAKS
jgi:hypothetical protein